MYTAEIIFRVARLSNPVLSSEFGVIAAAERNDTGKIFMLAAVGISVFLIFLFIAVLTICCYCKKCKGAKENKYKGRASGRLSFSAQDIEDIHVPDPETLNNIPKIVEESPPEECNDVSTILTNNDSKDKTEVMQSVDDVSNVNVEVEEEVKVEVEEKTKNKPKEYKVKWRLQTYVDNGNTKEWVEDKTDMSTPQNILAGGYTEVHLAKLGIEGYFPGGQHKLHGEWSNYRFTLHVGSAGSSERTPYEPFPSTEYTLADYFTELPLAEEKDLIVRIHKSTECQCGTCHQEYAVGKKSSKKNLLFHKVHKSHSKSNTSITTKEKVKESSHSKHGLFKKNHH